MPAGRIWKFTCGPLLGSVFPIWPSSVPAITRAPLRSGLRTELWAFKPSA